MRYEVYFFINLADTLPHERVGLMKDILNQFA